MAVKVSVPVCMDVIAVLVVLMVVLRLMMP